MGFAIAGITNAAKTPLTVSDPACLTPGVDTVDVVRVHASKVGVRTQSVASGTARIWRALLSLATVVLALAGAGGAQGGVIAAGAAAFDLDINLTITQPLLPTVTIVTGPVNFVSTSGPAGSASSSFPGFSLNPFVTINALDANATTSFVPLGAGSATASASIGGLSINIPLIVTFSATLIESTATSAHTVFVGGSGTSRISTTTLGGASLTVLGFNVGAIMLNPAPNTVLFSSGGVTVVLHNITPIPPFPDVLVDAMEITFLNAPFNPFGGLVNGTITIAESATTLTIVPPPPVVPEPVTLALIGIGLCALVLRRLAQRPFAQARVA